jgi:hypothetical protein
MRAERRQGAVPAEPVEARGIRPSTGSGRMLHPMLRGMPALYMACIRRTMTAARFADCRSSRLDCVEGSTPVASAEGGEHGGPPVRVQLDTAYSVSNLGTAPSSAAATARRPKDAANDLRASRTRELLESTRIGDLLHH